jgi:hypothetical protein
MPVATPAHKARRCRSWSAGSHGHGITTVTVQSQISGQITQIAFGKAVGQKGIF